MADANGDLRDRQTEAGARRQQLAIESETIAAQTRQNEPCPSSAEAFETGLRVQHRQAQNQANERRIDDALQMTAIHVALQVCREDQRALRMGA